MAEDELNLFLDAMADVVPLDATSKVNLVTATIDQQQAQRYAATKKREALARLSLELSEIPLRAPDEIICYRSEGIQSGVFKLFRQGKYQSQGMLDIKNSGLSRAREQLYDFIESSQRQGLRNVLIIHGTGVNNKPFPAQLKSAVAAWLPQLSGVIAFHSAIKAQGGEGALMVMLIKSETARLNTRELTAKGGHLRFI
ncbi:DNA endonuclease SmrA [Shewanella sp. AS1]|uniref:DNA endonuclease SmrA n=1 Tax=Shewanella sp. AS1 TaxID=2907626 RepID=UPI001F40E757|nr:DNA endonuclease SmrA [Shewanella sp. AS1]MCE9678537.1 DNA endonuclease SmrA [Shewanella sp. AS1]